MAESTKELSATGASVTTISAGASATAAPPDEPVAWTAGAPTAVLVPPGACFFGEEWSPVPLLARTWISKDTVIVAFGLPDDRALGLSTCACLLAKGGEDDKGEPFVRPYTPVSTNAMVGRFELMVKVYGAGNLSKVLSTMDVGATVDFKHIPFNVKKQYPFGPRVAMLVGGTGISPMLQALHAVLGTDGDTTQVTILYGSQSSDNILAKATLDAWAASHGDRLAVIHVLSNEPADSESPFERGFITKDLVQRHVPPPGEDCLVFVCGPPPLYDALCGPRGDAAVAGVLGELGYAPAQVVKF